MNMYYITSKMMNLVIEKNECRWTFIATVNGEGKSVPTVKYIHCDELTFSK